MPHSPASTPRTRSAAAQAQAEADAADFEQFIASQDPADVAAAGWMVRQQDGLTPEEEAELQAWLAADPANAEAVRRLEGVWGRMDELPQDDIDTLKTGLRHPEVFASPLPSSPPHRQHQRAWGFGLRQWLPTLATALALCVLLVGGWQGWSFWQAQPTFSQSFATSRGQQREVQLPDGSTLWLDTATQADVTLYRQRREVWLPEGQAQFAVQANAHQPFDVLAGPLRITVVGTRFAVRHTRTGLGDGGVSVMVEEGRVRVARADPSAQKASVDTNDSVVLTAGQSITTTAEGKLGLIAKEPAGTSTAWREGRINFIGTSLAQALAEFERYGDTHLRVRDPSVGALRIHGSFDLRRLDAFTRALPKVLPVQLRPTPDGVTEIVSAVSH